MPLANLSSGGMQASAPHRQVSVEGKDKRWLDSRRLTSVLGSHDSTRDDEVQNSWSDLEEYLEGDSADWIGVVGAVVGASSFLWLEVLWSPAPWFKLRQLTFRLPERTGPLTDALLPLEQGESRPDAPEMEDAQPGSRVEWFSWSDGHSPASVVSVELSWRREKNTLIIDHLQQRSQWKAKEGEDE